MDFSRPREQGCARGAGLAPVDVSSAVYPLLSHKSGILLPTPPLPSDQDPKNHHFLLACESLINSRQKGLIRKLFGKWKGRGRDGELATAGASGWFYPSASPPRAVGASLPWAPQICSSHGPNPVWLQDGSPSLSLCKDLGMKISVHIEAHIYFYFITVPWLFQEIFLQDSHGASLEGTRVSLIGTVPSLPSC